MEQLLDEKTDDVPMASVTLKREQKGYFKSFKEISNRFKGTDSASLCSLAGRYNNPIPTRFLAPIDCSTIPAQVSLLPCFGSSKKKTKSIGNYGCADSLLRLRVT